MDTQMATPSAENPQLSKIPSFKHGVGQNGASSASHAARNSSFLTSVIPAHSTSFSLSPHQSWCDVHHKQWIRLLLNSASSCYDRNLCGWLVIDQMSNIKKLTNKTKNVILLHHSPPHPHFFLFFFPFLFCFVLFVSQLKHLSNEITSHDNAYWVWGPPVYWGRHACRLATRWHRPGSQCGGCPPAERTALLPGKEGCHPWLNQRRRELSQSSAKQFQDKTLKQEWWLAF